MKAEQPEEAAWGSGQTTGDQKPGKLGRGSSSAIKQLCDLRQVTNPLSPHLQNERPELNHVQGPFQPNWLWPYDSEDTRWSWLNAPEQFSAQKLAGLW